MLNLVKIDYAVIAYLTVGIVFYAIAILTTFGRTLWEHSILGPTFGPLFMIGATALVGLGAIVLGYVMILILGGSLSLGLASLISWITGSKQIVELAKSKTILGGISKLLDRAHWLYMPGLVFISAVGLAWDVHNGDGPESGMLQPILHRLDIFSRPTSGVGPILFSRDLIPAQLIVTVLAGFVPATVLPYFGKKFKITGVNMGQFHKYLLYYSVGALTGLGVLLTLVGLFYRSLWLNRTPLPYHFGILSLLGFSLHFSLGMYLGMGKAEIKIIQRIHHSSSSKLVVLP